MSKVSLFLQLYPKDTIQHFAFAALIKQLYQRATPTVHIQYMVNMIFLKALKSSQTLMTQTVFS